MQEKGKGVHSPIHNREPLGFCGPTVQNVTLSRRLDFYGRAPFLVACGKLVKTLKEKLREAGRKNMRRGRVLVCLPKITRMILA
jgi:hypothetical protein